MSSTPSTELYPCIPLPAGSHEDIYELQAIRMVILHNIMIRGLNSIIVQAPEINTQQLQPFMKYCQLFAELIHHHHGIEEDLYFIMLEEKMGADAMGSNVDGHEHHKALLKSWEELCTSIKDGKTPFNTEEFVKTTREFGDIFVEHLREEIPTLSADNVRKHCSIEHMQLIEAKVGAKVQSESSLIWNAPFEFVNNEVTTGGWFPPMPKPIKFVVRNVLMPLHSDIWVFGTTDKNGNIKSRYASAEASA